MEYKRWYKGEVLYALFRYVLKGGGGLGPEKFYSQKDSTVGTESRPYPGTVQV